MASIADELEKTSIEGRNFANMTFRFYYFIRANDAVKWKRFL